MKHILPLKYPPIDNVARNAFLLSALLNHEEYYPWFYNNYIQLWSDINSYYIDFDFPNYTDPRVIPWINFSHIQKDFISRLNLDITSLLIKGIDEGYYTHLFLDEYFVPGTMDYHDFHFAHNILIHGYDRNKDCFYIAGFFGSPRKFMFNNIISFEELTKAYGSVDPKDDDLNGLVMFKSTPRITNYAKAYSNKFCFNRGYVIDCIQGYLDSKLNIDFINSNFIDVNENQRIFGITVIECVKDNYLDDILLGQRNVDHRIFQTLKIHKLCMLDRLNFMQENNYLHNSFEEINEYKNIVANAEVIQNLMLKYTINKNRDIITKVKKRLQELINAERHVLENILLKM